MFPAFKPEYYTLHSLPENAEIAIYGAGGRGQFIREKILKHRKDITVSAFVDTYKTGEFAGLPIYNLKNIDDLAPSIDLFLIASFWWVAILSNLKSRGIENFGMFIHESGTRHCMVLDQFKAIYIVNNKVAYSSLKASICSALGISFPDAYKCGIERPYVNLNDEQFKDYFIFSFVRNPWDRLVSCYEHFFNRAQDHYETQNYANPYAVMFGKTKVYFEDFVDFVANNDAEYLDPHWCAQTSLITINENNGLPDKIGRFENFEQDMTQIFLKAGIPLEIKHLNRSSRSKGNYKNYYTNRTRKLVQQRYKKDIEIFDYRF